MDADYRSPEMPFRQNAESGHCRHCRHFADATPYLVDDKPYGMWLEGRCVAAKTLHPQTMSWGGCHLWQRQKGA